MLLHHGQPHPLRQTRAKKNNDPFQSIVGSGQLHLYIKCQLGRLLASSFGQSPGWCGNRMPKCHLLRFIVVMVWRKRSRHRNFCLCNLHQTWNYVQRLCSPFAPRENRNVGGAIWLCNWIHGARLIRGWRGLFDRWIQRKVTQR